MSASHEQRDAAIHPVHPHVVPRLRIANALAVRRSIPWTEHARVVKSVRAHLVLDWIRERWNPTMVICRRHPLDVVASALALRTSHRLDRLAPEARAQARRRFGVDEPPPDDAVACMAWRTGFLMSTLDEQIDAHREIRVVDHEVMCQDPVGRFRELAGSLGLRWTGESEQFLVDHDRPGSGFHIERVAAEQPGKWRTRLGNDHARTAAAVVAQFPVGARYDLAVV